MKYPLRLSGDVHETENVHVSYIAWISEKMLSGHIKLHWSFF